MREAFFNNDSGCQASSDVLRSFGLYGCFPASTTRNEAIYSLHFLFLVWFKRFYDSGPIR